MVARCTATQTASTAALTRCAIQSVVSLLRVKLAPKCHLEDFLLETRNTRGRRQMLGTALGAAHVGVAAMAAGISGDRTQPLELRAVALVLHQRPRAVQRRWAKVVAIPGNDVTRAVAHPAADAFDRRVRQQPLRGRRIDSFKILVPGPASLELALG